FARRRPLAASAPVLDVRARRLLRLLAEQARDETLSFDQTPVGSLLRAGRRMGVVLRRRTPFRIALTWRWPEPTSPPPFSETSRDSGPRKPAGAPAACSLRSGRTRPRALGAAFLRPAGT